MSAVAVVGIKPFETETSAAIAAPIAQRPTIPSSIRKNARLRGALSDFSRTLLGTLLGTLVRTTRPDISLEFTVDSPPLHRVGNPNRKSQRRSSPGTSGQPRASRLWPFAPPHLEHVGPGRAKESRRGRGVRELRETSGHEKGRGQRAARPGDVALPLRPAPAGPAPNAGNTWHGSVSRYSSRRERGTSWPTSNRLDPFATNSRARRGCTLPRARITIAAC